MEVGRGGSISRSGGLTLASRLFVPGVLQGLQLHHWTQFSQQLCAAGVASAIAQTGCRGSEEIMSFDHGHMARK